MKCSSLILWPAWLSLANAAAILTQSQQQRPEAATQALPVDASFWGLNNLPRRAVSSLPAESLASATATGFGEDAELAGLQGDAEDAQDAKLLQANTAAVPGNTKDPLLCARFQGLESLATNLQRHAQGLTPGSSEGETIPSKPPMSRVPLVRLV